MLRKLMKYELRATGRIFLPFFGAMLALSVLNRIFYSGRVDRLIDSMRQNGKGMPLEVIRILSAIIFGFIICAVFVLAVIVTIQRYYKNLLGDEGYLMFTLPVRPWQLITSKMLIACMWMIVSIIVTILACLLLAVDMQTVTAIFIGIPGDFLKMNGMDRVHTVLLLIELFVMMAVYLCACILMVYAAISIGQLWSAHKLLGSFGAFLALNTVEQVITIFAAWVLGEITVNTSIIPARWVNEHAGFTLHCALWMLILWGVLLSAACFLISDRLLQKKLNLE